MKLRVLIILIIVLGLGIFSVFYFTGSDDLESAVSEYDDGDYIEAIIILNRIAPLADYEESEKIHFYRCKSINRLAADLEESYEDELRETALERKNDPGYTRALSELEKEIKEVNSEIQGDLAVVPAKKMSRIVTGGQFYNEFITRFRGSSLIEDLNFEELRRLENTDPAKYTAAVINFYRRYPHTDYIPQIVSSIFSALQKGLAPASENPDTVRKLLISYGKRYPTSPETSRIMVSTGDRVNLRNSPDLAGQPVGKILKDEILIQIEKTMDVSQIGNSRDYWYRVSTLKGLRGWVFGKFVSPVDLSRYTDTSAIESWAMEDHFDAWTDSHTPVNWNHVPGADPSSIMFYSKPDTSIAMIESPSNKTAGLYRPYRVPRSFHINMRARYSGGDAVTILACVSPAGNSFIIRLKKGTIEISGRTIPLHTEKWHEYTLSSKDGRYASLRVDGEIISGRIQPVKAASVFSRAGLYCLCSPEGESAKGEIDYLKVR